MVPAVQAALGFRGHREIIRGGVAFRGGPFSGERVNSVVRARLLLATRLSPARSLNTGFFFLGFGLGLIHSTYRESVAN